jgi:hypothetical protein
MYVNRHPTAALMIAVADGKSEGKESREASGITARLSNNSTGLSSSIEVDHDHPSSQP